MTYNDTVTGRFLDRPNRFVAHVEIEGNNEICHVKNTSRLTELLLPGTEVSVQRVQASRRKTGWDLIAVHHLGRWVNIDSQASNKVFAEWAAKSDWFGKNASFQPEVTHGDSRFDWYIEVDDRRILVEVKGVTLLKDGIASFPGAPTTRGVKHLRQLTCCLDEGYEAMMAFVAKRGDAKACAPNDTMDPAFGSTLRAAAAKGVQTLGLGCDVTANSLDISRTLKVIL